MTRPRVRVKICGVMSPAIATVAAEAGADAIGLIFAESRRRVSVAQASEIVAALPPFVAAVGVFVDAPQDEVLSLAHGLRLGAVQLHGEEAPEMVEAVRAQGIPVVKAVKVTNRVEPAVLDRYRAASAVMLDTKQDGIAGGTGRPFAWEAAVGLTERYRIVLSGGLSAENVTRALDLLRPFAVDVSSGVETDGQKDPEKIRRFLGQVRSWECAPNH